MPPYGLIGMMPNTGSLINASPRSEHTCPGEMSKSYRLAQIAQSVFLDERSARLVASEFGIRAPDSSLQSLLFNVPGALPLAMLLLPESFSRAGARLDERNLSAVGSITPVNWYQMTSPLKLMMDRLVCADGGNPDPTTTPGKDAAKAKAIELAGWYYPKHLAGRLFSIVVHGDAEGIVEVKRALSDWLTSMDLESAGATAELSRYIGYLKPYATSHEDLDRDIDLQEEVRLTARRKWFLFAPRTSTELLQPPLL